MARSRRTSSNRSSASRASFSFSETKTGWTIGGGVEQPFTLLGLLPASNWTIKTEYLYVDLGSTTNTYTLAGLPHTFTTEAASHIFRSGLNYHFNAGPVVAKVLIAPTF